MLNDIARENRLKDRLGKLKMISLSDAGVHVSGGKLDNKEGWFGFGKKEVKSEQEKELTVSPLERGETKTDLDKYIVLHTWTNYAGEYQWRYDLYDKNIHYIKNDKDEGSGEHPKRQIAEEKYEEMREEYTVTDQKMGFFADEVIEEVRLYKDLTQKLWRFCNGVWRDITPVVDRASVERESFVV